MKFITSLSKYRVLTAFLINIFLFSILLLVYTSLIHSQGDAYTLYILGGGFGNNPTHLLHFDHIYHPWITYLLKELFIIEPNVNWYTWLLLLLNLLGFTTILTVIFEKQYNTRAFVFYILLFSLYGNLFLLYLSINHVVILLTLASLSLIFPGAGKEKRGYAEYAAAFMLLILAASLRIHLTIFIIVLLLPFVFFQSRKKTHFFVILALFAGTVFLLNLTQKRYYIKNIPEWRKEEERRQNLYHFYNRSYLLDTTAAAWKTERSMISNALVWDSGFLSNEKLSAIQNDGIMKPDIKNLKTPGVRLLKNNRIYFLSFLAVLALYITRRMLLPLSVILIAVLLITLSLIIYFKVPGYYFTGICFSLSLFIYLLSNRVPGKSMTRIHYLAFFFFIYWGAILAYKNNLNNVLANKQFKQITGEISHHKDNIFLVVDNKFILKNFYAFDVPKNYPLGNVLLFDHYHSFMYKEILNRYGITDMKELITSERLLLWGHPPEDLLKYLEQAYAVRASFSEPLPEFKYEEVRRLIIK